MYKSSFSKIFLSLNVDGQQLHGGYFWENKIYELIIVEVRTALRLMAQKRE